MHPLRSPHSSPNNPFLIPYTEPLGRLMVAFFGVRAGFKVRGLGFRALHFGLGVWGISRSEQALKALNP